MTRHGDTTSFFGMFELPVTPFLLDKMPPVSMNRLEDVTYLHIVIFYAR